VCPEAVANSLLHASIKGRANVAPLPFNVSAKAGCAENISALAAVTITASDFLDFINFLHGIKLVWGMDLKPIESK
jgi:hypothetical protein